MTNTSQKPNSNTPFIIATVVIIGALGSIALVSRLSKTDNSSKTTDSSLNTTTQSSPSSENIQDTTNPDSLPTNSISDQSSTVLTTRYLEYSPNLLKQENITNRVLFFKADWCPSCNILDEDLNSNRDNIPANTLILDVDYDTNQDLRKKYGVTYQHTLVLVDKNGNQLKKWSGGRDLDSIISQL